MNDRHAIEAAPGLPIPHDDGAEAAVLGSMLLNGADCDLRADEFYGLTNQKVYGAIRALREAGSPVDAVTVNSELMQHGMKDTGNTVAGLLEGVCRTTNVDYYAKIIRRCAKRRNVITRCEGIKGAASNGATDTELRELIDDLLEDGPQADQPIPIAVDLWSAEISPQRPEFITDGLFRKVGLHLIWAAPGGFKTSLMLRWLHELSMRDRPSHLTGHPDLKIRSGFDHALIITTEEDAGELRYVAEAVDNGLGNPGLAGEIRHIYATGKRRITLDDLPTIIAEQGPFDCVVLDSLTGLRPKTVDGQRAKWDLDNDLANEQCLLLRGLAAEYRMAFWLIHHSDKQVQNYRGPTDWWASADVMFGLLAESGQIKVKPQKVRGGRVPEPFMIAPEWDGDRLGFTYAGVAQDEPLTRTDEKVLAYLSGAGQTAQYVIVEQVKANRKTIRNSLVKLQKRGSVEQSGESINNSPIWQAVEDPITQLERRSP